MIPAERSQFNSARALKGLTPLVDYPARKIPFLRSLLDCFLPAACTEKRF